MYHRPVLRVGILIRVTKILSDGDNVLHWGAYKRETDPRLFKIASSHSIITAIPVESRLLNILLAFIAYITCATPICCTRLQPEHSKPTQLELTAWHVQMHTQILRDDIHCVIELEESLLAERNCIYTVRRKRLCNPTAAYTDSEIRGLYCKAWQLPSKEQFTLSPSSYMSRSYLLFRILQYTCDGSLTTQNS